MAWGEGSQIYDLHAHRRAHGAPATSARGQVGMVIAGSRSIAVRGCWARNRRRARTGGRCRSGCRSRCWARSRRWTGRWQLGRNRCSHGSHRDCNRGWLAWRGQWARRGGGRSRRWRSPSLPLSGRTRSVATIRNSATARFGQRLGKAKSHHHDHHKPHRSRQQCSAYVGLQTKA